jgi:hypothetical protein
VAEAFGWCLMTASQKGPRERPILFSGEMVRAILDGRKTQTRRVVKPQPTSGHGLQPMWGTSPGENPVDFGEKYLWREVGPDYPDDETDDRRCPYGQPGDRLWVRETWAASFYWPMAGGWRQRQWRDVPAANRLPGDDTFVAFRATDSVHGCEGKRVDAVACGAADREDGSKWRWRPSIHMPRWASRITLEITDVRVERVQAITADDCIAEGIASRGMDRNGPNIASALMYLDDYKNLWDALNAKRGYGWDVNPWVWVLSFRNLDASAPSDRGKE